MYKELCKRLGRTATSKDINKDKIIPYTSGVFCIRFGGMEELRKLADREEYGRAKKQYIKHSLLQEIKKIYIQNEGKITVDELKLTCSENENMCSYATLLQYFKTTQINKVWNEVEQSLLKDYIKLLKKKNK